MTAKTYRVHVHDHADQGRWLAQTDFRRRPSRDEIPPRIPLLYEPGRYEVRITIVSGSLEFYLASWLQDAAPVRVIFRKFLDWDEDELGDGIIALFPDLPGDGRAGMCQSYMHVGQHGAASLRLIGGEPRTTRPATPGEYAALQRELEAPPYEYKLAVILRTPRGAGALAPR